MANFICVCKTCKSNVDNSQSDVKLSEDEYNAAILFQTSHRINVTEEQLKLAMTCPRCNSTDCEKTFLGYDIVGYIRGDGYLDKNGCRRDMNLYHLTNDDPYGEYRVAGEVDEMKSALVKAGRHNPNRKHYDVSSQVMQQAVAESVLPVQNQSESS